MPAYYNEFDPGAAAWLRELIKRGHIADGVVDERSILDVLADDLLGFTQCHFFAGIGGWSYALRLAGWPDDRPVWTGSPPCQPFSSAGRQLGRDDERHLAPHFISLVGAVRPPMLFGEQVASAAVFGGAAKSAKRGAANAPEWAWIDDLSDRLEAAHYAVGASDIPAAGIGAPHIRQRTFFGAVRLADADGQGPQGHRRPVKQHDQKGREIEERRPAARNLAAPIWGRPVQAERGADGVIRAMPPEPSAGIDGVSARVGRLRGYGNAIVPQAASEFIKAFSDVIGS